MAILDTECWVEDNQVLWTFYKKSVATDEVLGPNSGLSPQVLRNILLHKYLRRLLNCSRQLPDYTKFEFISRLAGHTEKIRRTLTAWSWLSYQKN